MRRGGGVRGGRKWIKSQKMERKGVKAEKIKCILGVFLQLSVYPGCLG